MRRLRTLAVLCAAVVPLLLGTGTAQASTVTTGDAVFDGTAFLPQFPCPNQPPNACSGSLGGTWSGNLSGTNNGNPFSVAWVNGNIGASFTYWEFQCISSLATTAGFAQGTGSATALGGQVAGEYQVVGETLPRAVNSVSVSFSFQWTRVLNTAFITLQPLSTTIGVNGLGTITVLNTGQQAEAVFVPTQAGNPLPTVPSCATPINNVQGAVAGDVPLEGTMTP